MKIENTLNVLLAQRESLEEQLGRLSKFERLLLIINATPYEMPEGISFEVHFQQSNPEQYPIMTVGGSLVEVYERAVTLRDEYNRNSPQHRAEVFMRIDSEGLRMALSPTDAASIMTGHAGGKEYQPESFCIDSRLVEKVGKTVWRVDETLPGYHSSKPTPDKIEEVLA